MAVKKQSKKLTAHELNTKQTPKGGIDNHNTFRCITKIKHAKVPSDTMEHPTRNIINNKLI